MARWKRHKRSGFLASLLSGAGMVLSCSATCAMGVALSPRTPGRRFTYYALVFGARAPLIACVAALGAPFSRSRFGKLCGAVTLVLGGIISLELLQTAREHSLRPSVGDIVVGATRGTCSPELVEFAARNGRPMYADVYRASESKHAGAAILVVHGGAWVGGDKSESVVFDAWLAARGYVVMDIQYRLGTHWRLPVEDIHSALGWLRAHAEDLGIHPNRIVLFGRSAGGHLALLVAYTSEAHIAAVIAYYAPTDLARAYAEAQGRRAAELRRRLEALTGGTAEQYRLASPLTHVGAASPPTLLIHGTLDRAVPYGHSQRLYAALHSVGARAELVTLPFARHAFDIVPYGLATALAHEASLRFVRQSTLLA